VGWEGPLAAALEGLSWAIVMGIGLVVVHILRRKGKI